MYNSHRGTHQKKKKPKAPNKPRVNAMEQEDQMKTTTSWCLRITPARQFLGKASDTTELSNSYYWKTQIKKKKPYKTRKRWNTKLRTLKKTGMKLYIALKSRIGCSKLATITSTVPMSKIQTNSFLKIIILDLKKKKDSWKAVANSKINNPVIPRMKAHEMCMDDKSAI